MAESASLKKILIVNDDGIYAPGLLNLVEALYASKRYDLRVCAPNREQSAVSHAITVHSKICVEDHTFDGAISEVKAVRTSGFPADCVKVALSGHLFGDWRPDLILSGINRGGNAALNVVYSGTVGGALEGCMNDISSVALSLDFPPNWHKGTEYWPYDKAAARCLPFVEQVLADPLPRGVALNINFPNKMDEVKGVRWCKQGVSMWDETFLLETGEDGKRYLSMRGRMAMRDASLDYDENALRAGWITVTPVGFQQDVPAEAQRLSSWSMFTQAENGTPGTGEPDTKKAKVQDE
eukprot:TRINITY_DN6990_c0_g1_i1.p1 TRINITY_DN6990_c0_g1~~TRINITY_DN6990_c0_g1_i1.p1  ORF type:complete len:295 (+),score=80.91 TRINITY_DN6990_c0_g1_i1:57-941(+)